MSLGTYNSFEEAKEARIKAELKYFGEFMRDVEGNEDVF